MSPKTNPQTTTRMNFLEELRELKVFKTFALKTKDAEVIEMLERLLRSVKGVKVFRREYYNHTVFVVLTQVDYFCIVFSRSYKEWNVPKKELDRFFETGLRVLGNFIKKLTSANILAGKKCAGVVVFLIGNFATEHVGTKIKQGFLNGKRVVVGRVVIKRCYNDCDAMWCYTLVKAQKNWIAGRLKGLRKAVDPNEDLDKNKLYTTLVEILQALTKLESRLEKEMDVRPQETALVLTSTALLRSIGLRADVQAVESMFRAFGVAYNVSRRKQLFDVSITQTCIKYDVLERLCNNVNGEYKPRRSLVTTATQLVHTVLGGSAIKRIVVFDDKAVEGYDFEQCLVLYTAHWLTKNRIVQDWSHFETVLTGLVEIAMRQVEVRSNELWKFVDWLKTKNDVPALLLTSKALQKVWRKVYSKIKR